MIITPIKTHKITPNDCAIYNLLDQYLPSDIPERSVIAVSSKIVSICEGRVVKIEDADKDELIKQEASYYIPRSSSKYNLAFTITNDILSVSAGIDESNGNGHYVLWPKNPQESANKIRKHIAERLGLSEVGVIITDSKTSPLRWGVTGIALAHSGFMALKNYVGDTDLFGRKFEYEKLNIADCLASAAVVVMGEGSEQTPLAIIEALPFVQFQDHDPTDEELAMLKITMEEDIFAPFLKNVPWKKGKKSQ
ncbi:MAG: coenzyme F420-0:L-glutamate ligase [Candidatus Levybacteria bacterium]|nr:coenzyme F420-0:L-glutamate ligase [Candidatus Levybacteria bacterium]